MCIKTTINARLKKLIRAINATKKLIARQL